MKIENRAVPVTQTIGGFVDPENRTTLNTYSHVLPNMERSTADKLGNMLYRSGSSHQ